MHNFYNTEYTVYLLISVIWHMLHALIAQSWTTCINFRVCKRWKRVVKDKYLWKYVNFSPYSVSKVNFTKIARQCFNEFTKELKLCGTWRRSTAKETGCVVSDNVFNILTQRCLNLKKLEVYTITYTHIYIHYSV